MISFATLRIIPRFTTDYALEGEAVAEGKGGVPVQILLQEEPKGLCSEICAELLLGITGVASRSKRTGTVRLLLEATDNF